MTPASPAPGVESGLESPKDSSIKVSRKEKTNGAFARSLMVILILLFILFFKILFSIFF